MDSSTGPASAGSADVSINAAVTAIIAIAFTVERLTEVVWVICSAWLGSRDDDEAVKIALAAENKKKYERKSEDLFPGKKKADGKPEKKKADGKPEKKKADGKPATEYGKPVDSVRSADIVMFSDRVYSMYDNPDKRQKYCGSRMSATAVKFFVVPDEDVPDGVQERGAILLKAKISRFAKQVASMCVSIPLGIAVAYLIESSMDSTKIIGLKSTVTDYCVAGVVAGFLAPYSHQLIQLGFKMNEDMAWAKKVEDAKDKAKEEGKAAEKAAGAEEGKKKALQDLLSIPGVKDSDKKKLLVALAAMGDQLLDDPNKPDTSNAPSRKVDSFLDSRDFTAGLKGVDYDDNKDPRHAIDIAV